MKKLLFLFVLILNSSLFIADSAKAQTPQQFNYQGVARDNGGNILANQSIGLQMDIRQTTATGTVVYSETQSVITNDFGLFNLQIGNGTPTTGTVAGIDWSNGPYFLEVSLDASGGTNYQSMGVSQLLSVPYALYAETAGNASTDQTTLQDGDEDTKIQVEESADEDIIRFDIAGNERYRLDDVRLEFLNNYGNIFMGEDAGNSSFQSSNLIGIGTYVLENNSSGQDNVAIGHWAQRSNTTGENNIAIGTLALLNNTTGYSNTALGHLAAQFNTTGYFNTVVGSGALRLNISGNENTAIGTEAGANSTGNKNVFIGRQAGFLEEGSNKLYIENSTADSSNALIYGEFDNDLLAINGTLRVNDGTQADGYVLTSDANGNASWTVPSFNSMFTNVVSVQDGCASGGYTVLDASHYNAGLLSGFPDQWQSYTAEQSGILDTVAFNFHSEPLSPVTIRIYEGEGTTELIDETTIGGSFIEGWNYFDVSSLDIPVISGEQYTIQVAGSQQLKGSTDNEYAGGRHSQNPNYDLNFEVYIALPCQDAVISLSSDSLGVMVNGIDTLNFSDGTYLTSSTALTDTDRDTKIQVEESPDEDHIRFDVGGTEAMVIDGTGKVTMENGLDVKTTDATTETRVFSLSSSTGRILQVLAPDINVNNDPFVFQTGNAFQFRTDSDNALTIDANGNVGIGISDPVYALQVGDAGDGTVARANAWNTFSDRRWKKDFIIIPDALDKLNQVNGYFYNWKEGADTTQQVGVIAQEIEEILPQAVSTDENGYKSVDYGKLAAWLIQVNKEQQKQIEHLRIELVAEKESNAARLERLERQLGMGLNANR